MKRLSSLTFLLAAAAHTLTAQVLPQLQVKEMTLSNGMTVWLNEDHSQPKVYGAVVVRAGAKDCPGTGIAHYFEHIMFKGTERMGTTDYARERPWLDSISAQYDLLSRTTDQQRRTAIQQRINELSLRAADYAIPNEYSRLISRYGGSDLNAATGMDVTYYHNTFMPQYIAQWCWLSSERFISPVFRLFQAELENVYEEKNRSADEMGDALDKALAVIFRDQPYAQPILGTTDNLKNPRLSDMVQFFRKYYVAPNMGLLLCGDIVADSLAPLLEQTFGRLPTGPVPQRAKAVMPPVKTGERVGIKLPLPLVKIVAQVSQAPTDFDPDANALDLANALLTNGKAGLLDSLMNDHALLMAMAARTAFCDAGMQILAVVPKLPFGKKQKAVDACRRQMERIKQGDFTDEQLEAVRRDALREAEQALETIDSRAALMLDAFSQGQSWQTVMQQLEQLRTITRDDVMHAAQKYYTDDHITFVKKYGKSDKETLKQPGYKPVEPKNNGAKSDFARQLEQMPVDTKAIRTVDFEHAAQCTDVTPHVKLYSTENTMNDIFSLTLRFLDGKRHTPLLGCLDSYLSSLGTDSLTKQQMETAWLRMGVDFGIEAGNRTFSFTITGREAQLRPALRLLAHFLGHAKGDDKALRDTKQGVRVADKSFGEEKDDVMRAVLSWVLYGPQSSYLRQTSASEAKALTNERLLALLDELTTYDCELIFCGQTPPDELARIARETLPLGRCHKAGADDYVRTQEQQDNLVFFYHVPKSRQNYVVSVESLAAEPSWMGRVTADLWSRYMGGGMASVLFQNVREFRSLAYSTGGMLSKPDMARHATDPMAFVTITGTQADKTPAAMHTVDSLLHHMPMNAENFEATRQEMLNDVQNAYPSFRSMPAFIADQRLTGYQSDPDEHYVRLAPSINQEQVEQYHQDHVAKNKRVWIVVGDKKLTDFQTLQKYGRVVQLKKNDVWR